LTIDARCILVVTTEGAAAPRSLDQVNNNDVLDVTQRDEGVETEGSLSNGDRVDGIGVSRTVFGWHLRQGANLSCLSCGVNDNTMYQRRRLGTLGWDDMEGEVMCLRCWDGRLTGRVKPGESKPVKPEPPELPEERPVATR
jgi:hypothetical protein